MDDERIYRDLQQQAESLNKDIIANRRYLHQYPELSWKETRTAEFLIAKLQEIDLSVNAEVCGTGVVAELKGARPGPTLAIRADMDALPIHDSKDAPYASRVPGIMHACGHDCHMAMALGVANVLSRISRRFPGKVRFVFQPCEEATPSGAHEMVNAGVMDGVDGVLAFHVDPELPVGKIGLRTGVLTAHCTEFSLRIFGRSGHAARPHQAIDTIHLSNRVLSALYDLVAERSQPFVPAVLTVGKMAGGTKANVIPDVVDIAGTIRTLDARSQAEMVNALDAKVRAIVHAVGGRYQLEFPMPVPSVVNDAGLINMVREVVASQWSDERITNIDKVSMGGEDFSWYLTKTRGALIRLGAKKPGCEVTFLHTNDFDVDERALPFGVSLMSMLVWRYLHAGASS